MPLRAMRGTRRRTARGAHRARPAQGAAQPLQAPALRSQERSQRRAPEGPVLQRGRGRRRIGPACSRRDRGREDRRAGAPAHQARPQAAGSGPAARGAAPRAARRRARVPARRRGAARDRRGGQRATGHRAAAGARDPPRAGEVRVPVLRRRPAPGGQAAAGDPQGAAQRGGAGLGDHVEVPGRPAAVPAGRAAGPLRRHAAVAQHAGRQRRAGGPGHAAGDQPAARRAAGLVHRPRRRDRGAGAQGAWKKSPGQELHVGADDRSQRGGRHRAADPAVRLLAQSQHALGQDTVRGHAARAAC